jgi:hypothetical protein
MEAAMPNAVVEGLFLFAFWAPPLTVVAGGLLLLVNTPARQTSPLTAQTATAQIATAHR